MRNVFYRSLLCFLLGCSLAVIAGADASYRVSAAKGPYFLCDERVIEDRWLIERFVVPPVKHSANPLIIRDHAWEGTGPHMGGSVLHDPEDGVYKLWYSVWNRYAYYNDLPFSYNVCYAESEDGLIWRKPELGVFDYEGSTANNIIRLGTDKTQNINVQFNPRPEQWPGKFLAIHNQKGGVFISSSDDGKIFTRLWPEKPAISYHSDTHNNFVFDEVRGLWFLYCRPRAWAGYHRRRVAVKQSEDLEDWTHERTILLPTETEIPEYYGMTVFRRGDLYFGTVQIYDKETGYMYPELAWSGDGSRWTFLPTHEPFVELGLEDAWDHGMILVTDEPVVHGDEMWFYYGGFALDHNTKEENIGSIGLLVSERDRLAGLRPATTEPGLIMTRPFIPDERRLVVNARVQGEIAAELRTDGNKVIDGWSFDDCDKVNASGFAQELTWGGRPIGAVNADVPGREVRILFRLQDAELFTFDLLPIH